MTNDTTTDTDGLQELVRAFGEAMYNDPGEKPMPMASTDAEEAIKAQLTENTGTHFLDSGKFLGRHWEENQENPPWEKAAWNVNRDYVTHSVYHFMDRALGRDRTCVALEAALYAFGRTDDWKRDGWLTCMEAFAEGMRDDHFVAADFREWGVPEGFVSDVLAVQAEMQPSRSRTYGTGTEKKPIFSVNTYNHSVHPLTQVLQGTNFGGPYAEYAMIQTHQGGDVRGGYAGPRVYSPTGGWPPGELWYNCDRCGCNEAESTLHDSDEFLYQRSIDPEALLDAVQERTDDNLSGEEIQSAVDAAIEDAHDADHIDGAVFHAADGCAGHVRFS